MSSAVVADTHTIIWHFERSPKLSTPAHTAIIQAALAGDPIYVPSISIIEVDYLVEKGKLPDIAYTRLVDALIDPDTAFKIAPLDLDVAQAVRRIPRDIVPDMPDRIIAGTALYLGLPLITCDTKIRAVGIATVW